MERHKATCRGAELADIITYAWHTKAGALAAARKIVEQEQRAAAAQKLEAAKELLNSDIPPDVVLQYINEAMAALGDIESGQAKHPLDLDPLRYSARRFDEYRRLFPCWSG